MKNNKVTIIALIIMIICSIIGIISYGISQKNNTVEVEIPSDYISIFHGGVGERTFSTYIYKIDNGEINRGFKYINTTNTTKSYGSSEWIYTITGSGEVEWTDDVFKVAKENKAYSYVTVPGLDGTLTIEEYESMFLMN